LAQAHLVLLPSTPGRIAAAPLRRFSRMRVLSIALLGLAPASVRASENALNPIRKVVNLLQQMQAKVSAEGEKEKELYEKFMCYCKHGAGDLEQSISSADTKVTQLGSDIEAASSKKAETESDLKQHQVDRDAAIKAMQEATGIREKEAAAFAKLKNEHNTNAAALDKAITALEKGMAGSFLQSYSADVLRKLTSDRRDINEDDRQTILAFLSSKSDSEYSPQSGQIVGILKELQDEMGGSLKEASEAEDAAIRSFEELMAAKKKEKAFLSEAIETKTARIGELGVSIAQMKNDKEDTSEAMAADTQLKAELRKSCDTKTAEWEERSKVRAEELVALADTIKVLNDDDALELFKATLPSPSAFVQVRASTMALRARALAAIKQGMAKVIRADRPQLDLISLALRGKKIGFDKIIAMIDKMVETLATEQSDDDHKKEYCQGQLDSTDDKKKDLERKVSDREADMANAKEAISTLEEELAALQAGVKALDKSVAEATENRKAEHEEFTSLMASNSAAKEVLAFARNRLNKFYNPKLFKAPPKRELSAEDRIAVNMGGTAAPEAAPGGIAGTGITVLAEVSQHVQLKSALPPPPETFGAYRTKSEENNGVIEMINMLIKDLDKEMTEAETQEKDAQADYETLMQDSAEKRAADTKSISEKESAKAETEGALERHTDDRDSAKKELGATMMYIQSLHGECDFILQYHSARKEARDSEVDSLKEAKAVLSGADYALLQTRSRGFLRGAM